MYIDLCSGALCAALFQTIYPHALSLLRPRMRSELLLGVGTVLVAVTPGTIVMGALEYWFDHDFLSWWWMISFVFVGLVWEVLSDRRQGGSLCRTADPQGSKR